MRPPKVGFRPLTKENYYEADPLSILESVRRTMQPLPCVQAASSPSNLAIEFTPVAGGPPQTKAATRISLDGKGGLVLCNGREAMERLVLNEIRDLRIEPLRRLGADAVPAPLRKPVTAPVVTKYTYVLIA